MSSAATPSRETAVFTVTLVVSVLATVFTGLRMLSKGWIVRRFTSDDWFTVLAWVFSLGVSVSAMIGARNGLGRVDSDIPADMVDPQMRSIYSFTIFYNLSLMATKTAILILYVRMAAAHQFLRYASIATMAVVNLAGVALVLINIFRCHPIRAAYSSEDGGTCLNLISIFLSSSPVNILTDLAILLLPLPILTRLRMPFRQKCVLVATFVVGGFVTVIDVVRVVYLQNALKAEYNASTSVIYALNKLDNEQSKDFGYHVSYSVMWSSVEVSVGLMCCCVLVLKPLVLRLLPAIIKDPNRTGTSKGTATTLQSYQLSDPAARSPLSQTEPLRTVREESSAVAPSVAEANGVENGEGADDGGTMDLLNMLASDVPDQGRAPAPATTTFAKNLPPSRKIPAKASKYAGVWSLRKSWSTGTSSRDQSQEPSQVFFDFVKMGGRKPLPELSKKQALGPVVTASTLFFLWGFGYGLIGTLNSKVQAIHGFSAPKTLALNCAFSIGYIFGPSCIAYWILTRHGFKATFIAGLAIYSAGAMAFWPSAILASYGGFFVSNFIIALGLSTLECAANPFIVLAGPGELAEARLNFSQALQGVGAIVAPIIAAKALFSEETGNRLFNVQWCYLAVAIFVLFLAVVFFYIPLSEADDDALERDTAYRLERAEMDKDVKVSGMKVRHLLLGTGVACMWAYVGAQETLNYWWPTLSQRVKPGFDTLWGRSISRATYCVGRFSAAGLCYVGVPPRLVLAVHTVGAFVTCLLAMLLPIGNGTYAALILIEYFESAIFPTLYAITVRNQGRHTKSAATFLTMAICAGAIWPSVGYAVVHHRPERPRLIMSVSVALFGVLIMWSTWLSWRKPVRRWIDPRWSRRPIEDRANGPRGSVATGRFVDERALAKGGVVSGGLMDVGGLLNSEGDVGNVGLGIQLPGADGRREDPGACNEKG
ncbi:hypothetical protein IAT38_006409 [Cryptococcus sp. DSM 104549]